ncbi:hypothetical protein H0266_05920 [Halobacillus locisalis]|uniref:Uncharacterized protein n=1 Tax=Halobacillus locisalis TaxID=220753 RepID=A0A838CQP4_9BACI|nr:hypothetical protein [Halobacillus locisalis]MBA2174442.1 hypothetical protein [Halobacillus locisalis]
MLNRLPLIITGWGTAVVLFLINRFTFEGIMEIGWILPPLIVLPFIKKQPVRF